VDKIFSLDSSSEDIANLFLNSKFDLLYQGDAASFLRPLAKRAHAIIGNGVFYAQKSD
jgi:hypothetical protein